MRILLVEDDAMIGQAVLDVLRTEHYAVDWVRDGAAADSALVAEPYDLVLLDLGLPKADGLQVLRSLRARRDPVPVLVATARDAVGDRVAGLDAGADDYIVKPFQLDELLARLRAVVRRSSNAVVSALRCRDVVLEPARRAVTRDGVEVNLSAHEYRTLLALMERVGHTVSREQLEAAVYGDSGAIESNTVAVYIHQLRRKLGDKLIVTVHGLGYRIEAPE